MAKNNDIKLNVRVVDAQVETNLADGSEFLAVSYELLDGNKVVAERKEGFATDASEKEIQQSLKKSAELYVHEQEQATAQAEQDRHAEEVNNKVANLKGLEL